MALPLTTVFDAVVELTLHEVERARLEREIALHRHRAGRVAGRKRAAAHDRGRAHGAGAGERAACVHRHRRIGDRAVDDQRAGIDRPRQRGGVRPGQRPSAGAGFLEHAEALILRARPDLRDVEARAAAAAERQGVGRAERHDVAGDGRAGTQFERVGAAGERDGVGARHPVAGEAAGDAAAVEDGEPRADDARAARARAAVGGGAGADPACSAIATGD